MWPLAFVAQPAWPERRTQPQPTIAQLGVWLRNRALPEAPRGWRKVRAYGRFWYASRDGRWRLRPDGLVRRADRNEPPDVIPRSIYDGLSRSSELATVLDWIAGGPLTHEYADEDAFTGWLATAATAQYLAARYEDVLRAFVADDDRLALARLHRLERDWLELQVRFGRGWYGPLFFGPLEQGIATDFAALKWQLEHPVTPASLPKAVRDLDRVGGRYANSYLSDPIYRRAVNGSEEVRAALRWVAANDHRLVRRVFAASRKELGGYRLVRVSTVAESALRRERPRIEFVTFLSEPPVAPRSH